MRFFITVLFFSVLELSFAQEGHLRIDLNAQAEGDRAIYGVANNDQLARTYGVYGFSNATDGVGVYGNGKSGVFAQGNVYGIFAAAPIRAGYFSGDLEYTGTLHGAPSDVKLKNLLPNESSILDMIMDLRIEKYTYKHGEYKQLNLSKGVQYGFIAQDLEVNFPNLVNQSYAPAFFNAEKGSLVESVEYKTVNYIGMVPVLAQGIQELNKKIEKQEEIIKILLHEISELKAK